MKLGHTLGLVTAAVGLTFGGCGSTPGSAPLDSCVKDGLWTGTGACGITSFTMAHASSDITLSNFGSNATASFAADSGRTEAMANGLIVLDVPNHECTLSCNGDGSLQLHCVNAAGGTCDSKFTVSQGAQ